MPNERRIVPKYEPPGFSTAPKPDPKPAVKAIEGPKEKPPGDKPKPRKPAKDRMAEVTVKLPKALIEKLDRLARKHSAGLVKAGRSTVLRWLLEQHPE